MSLAPGSAAASVGPHWPHRSLLLARDRAPTPHTPLLPGGRFTPRLASPPSVQINHKGKFFVYDVLNERKEFDSINELLECYQNFDPSLPGGLPALLTRCIPPAASGSR